MAADAGPTARIVRGRLAPLDGVPFHEAGPLTRWLLAGRELDAACTHRVAVHAFDDVAPERRAYCAPHVHPYDEIDVLHTTTALSVEVRLGDAVTVVEAPATVFVPAGVTHAFNVVSGSGFLVAILASGAYEASGG